MRNTFQIEIYFTKIINFSSLTDLKAADEGGVAIANATDQDTNELFQEPKDVVHHDNVVVSEIPGENVSTVNTSEQEKKATNDETKEFVPKKQPPKNVVTSLAEWVSKASAAPPVVMKGETKNIDSGSRSQAKRYHSLYIVLLRRHNLIQENNCFLSILPSDLRRIREGLSCQALLVKEKLNELARLVARAYLARTRLSDTT